MPPRGDCQRWPRLVVYDIDVDISSHCTGCRPTSTLRMYVRHVCPSTSYSNCKKTEARIRSSSCVFLRVPRGCSADLQISLSVIVGVRKPGQALKLRCATGVGYLCCGCNCHTTCIIPSPCHRVCVPHALLTVHVDGRVHLRVSDTVDMLKLNECTALHRRSNIHRHTSQSSTSNRRLHLSLACTIKSSANACNCLPTQ
jgi:hypothetical protein